MNEGERKLRKMCVFAKKCFLAVLISGFVFHGSIKNVLAKENWDFWTINTVAQVLFSRLFADSRFNSISSDERFGTTTVKNWEYDWDGFKLTADEIIIIPNRKLISNSMKFGGTYKLMGLNIPLRGEAIPRGMNEIVQTTGLSQIQGDMIISIEYDLAQSDLSVSALMQLNQVGNVSADLELSRLHFGASPLDVFFEIGRGNAPSSPPELRGVLDSLKIRLTDQGGVEKAIAYIAAQDNKRPSKVRKELPRFIEKGITGFIRDTLDEEDKKIIVKSASTLRGFIEKPSNISVVIAPEETIFLEDLEDIIEDQDFKTLNLQVFSGLTDEKRIINSEKAYQEALKSETSGDVYKLALKYFKGDGVPQNFAKAIKLMGSRKEVVDPEITLLKARIYLDGIGVEKDLEEAYSNALMAGALGEPAAIALLTKIEKIMPVDQVFSIQQDTLEAWGKSEDAVYFKKKRDAAYSGDLIAMRGLAEGFQQGVMLPRNYYQAYIWSNIAAAAGDELSESMRAGLLAASMEHGVLSGKQISQAQDRASEIWIENVSKGILGRKN